MPGYVMHLAAAEEIIRQCRLTDNKYINDFKLGSIAPDAVERSDKKDSHFWDDNTFRRFERKPNLDMFLSKYSGRLKEPYVFGYYCHLYLDNRFMDEYWKRHFEFYDEDMRKAEAFEAVARVRLLDNNRIYDRTEFFSDRYYYGDYDRLNPYIVKKYGVKIPEFAIPEHEIDEISMEAVRDCLCEHIKAVYAIAQSDTIEAVRVFKVSDLDELILDTALKLAELYMKLMQQ